MIHYHLINVRRGVGPSFELARRLKERVTLHALLLIEYVSVSRVKQLRLRIICVCALGVIRGQFVIAMDDHGE